MDHLHWRSRPALQRPVLLVAFEGWNDAGDAASGAVRYLIDRYDAELVAEIDPEEFFDFTSTRPQAEIGDDGVRRINWPSTEVYAATLPGDGGDALLSQVGRLLQAQSRAEDIACRFGGEEFTMILPEMDAAGALARAERVRELVEGLQVWHLRETLTPVTASIGYACCPDDAREAADLLRLADMALYRAKREGRNRVIHVAALEET